MYHILTFLKLLSYAQIGFLSDCLIIVYVDKRNIEMHMRETVATANVSMQESEQRSIIHIYQEATTKLLAFMNFECVSYLYIHSANGTFYTMCVISYDDSFTIPPSRQDEMYIFTVRLRFGVEQPQRSTISIRPQIRVLEPGQRNYPWMI